MTIQSNPAGIEYHGVAGASRECQDAVIRLLQFGEPITRARLLSHANRHCFLLRNEVGDIIAIKSGFSSGYRGEGPTRLSSTLQFLQAHKVEIDEIAIESVTIERIDNSTLTTSELERLETTESIRPSRWSDYIFEEHYQSWRDRTLWQGLRPLVPFAIIDHRIMDLALSFWEAPGDNLIKGYIRLEDLVRERTGLDEHGAKLFSKAFSGAASPLQWGKIDEGEKAGRSQLFTGAYMAHRNPRAHRELSSDASTQLTELLLLNHLYRLEREAQTIASS